MATKVTVVSRSPNRVSVNSTNEKVIRTLKIGQATRLSQLTDVDTSDSDSGETLVFNEITQKFEIKTLPAIDGGMF